METPEHRQHRLKRTDERAEWRLGRLTADELGKKVGVTGRNIRWMVSRGMVVPGAFSEGAGYCCGWTFPDTAETLACVVAWRAAYAPPGRKRKVRVCVCAQKEG